MLSCTDGGSLAPSSRESLQVHVRKEFIDKQARQNNMSSPQTSNKSYTDKALLEACRCGDTELVEICLKHPGSFDVQNRTRKSLLLEALKNAILLGYHDVVESLLSLRISIRGSGGTYPGPTARFLFNLPLKEATC